MARLVKNAKATDFIRPEDPRPERGPVYAINTTKHRVVFAPKNDRPAFSFAAYPSTRSIAQIPVEMLDSIEFLRLWAAGDLAVSINPNVAKTYTSLELDKTEERTKREQAVKESIISRDQTGDYEVHDNEGLPKVVRKKKVEEAPTEDKAPAKTKSAPKPKVESAE